ncbi:MAG TPA: hypothetical protein VF163_21190 [Micromonosporaceae bacterium]
MTDPSSSPQQSGQSRAKTASGYDPFDPMSKDRANWLDRRREKVRAEIERNRRGEYKVPTWVLAVTLVAIVGAWVALIVLT